ncbi:MAG: peptide-methionine (S)-S-oxide reductase MsrA [Gammaproteobacteria bacterium]|nr:peptide-methionine (S)-S-oxide reductase MsrA [Gammaproteobacteria bacterium]
MNNLIFLGGGCFWCLEAIFQNLSGVDEVEPGYANGNGCNPSYQQVCSGATGFVEVIKIQYQSHILSLESILAIFFSSHDPTSLNRQGNDIGDQYRSGIYSHSLEDRERATIYIKQLTDFAPKKILTEVLPLNNYYPAEDYHKNYFLNNPQQAYCLAVIQPKLNKFYKNHQALLKK